MTETYNPILYKQYVSIWQMFIPNQAPPDDMSYLYARNGVIMPAQPGNYFARMNDIRYAIDIGKHTISFDCSLPSNHDAVEFRADVQLTCQVVDPQIIVQRRITDACAAVRSPLTRQMRLDSRAFDVSMANRSRVEDAVNQAILKQPIWSGFKVSDVIVRLGLSDEELEHQRKLRRIAREIEFHTQDTLFQDQRTAVDQKRRRQTVDFYTDMVQEGNGRLVLLHLAEHPEEARDIARLLTQLQKEDQEHWLGALMKLKDSDFLEEHHVQEVRDFILQQLKNRQKQEQILEELLERAVGQSAG